MIPCEICNKEIEGDRPVCYERDGNGENGTPCGKLYWRKINPEKAKVRMCLPKNKWFKDFENYVGGDELIEDLKNLLAPALSFLPKFLLFTGNVGCGKTHLAIALIREWANIHPVSIKFRDTYEIMEKIKATFNGEETAYDLIKNYSNIGILLIDDLGVMKVTEYQMDVLYQIINKRMENGHITIITTNLTGTELSEKYDRRIASRIFSGYVFKMNKVQDYRLATNHVKEYDV